MYISEKKLKLIQDELELFNIYYNEICEIPRLSSKKEDVLFEKINEKSIINDKLYDVEMKLFENPIEGYNELLEEYDSLMWELDDIENAKIKLIKSNLKLVVYVAKKYIGQGLRFMDLIQEGNVALEKIIGKFDCKMGYRFSTFAVHAIEKEIQRSIIKFSNTIYKPEYIFNKLRKYKKIRDKTNDEYGDELEYFECYSYDDSLELNGYIYRNVRVFLDDLNSEIYTLEKLIEQPYSYDYLNEKIFKSNDNILNYIPDANDDPYEFAKKIALREEIDRVLADLTEREERVLRLRFGFFDGRQWTLEETGKEFGVTRERIIEIESKAFRKIKHSSRLKRIKELYYG